MHAYECEIHNIELTRYLNCLILLSSCDLNPLSTGSICCRYLQESARFLQTPHARPLTTPAPFRADASTATAIRECGGCCKWRWTIFIEVSLRSSGEWHLTKLQSNGMTWNILGHFRFHILNGVARALLEFHVRRPACNQAISTSRRSKCSKTLSLSHTISLCLTYEIACGMERDYRTGEGASRTDEIVVAHVEIGAIEERGRLATSNRLRIL